MDDKPVTEQRFWDIIEQSWSNVTAEVQQARQNLLRNAVSNFDAQNLHRALKESVVLVYEEQIDDLRKPQLIEFDRILERKLFDIDREDIHKKHGGPVERFLFARSFIVLAGKDYYDAVKDDPSRVVPQLEAEEMSRSAKLYYYHKHDEEMPRTDISIETFSNKRGWPSRKNQ